MPSINGEIIMSVEELIDELKEYKPTQLVYGLVIGEARPIYKTEQDSEEENVYLYIDG
jgi:hypothetical protein